MRATRALRSSTETARLQRDTQHQQEALDALRANPDMSHNKATTELGYSPRPVHETLNDIFDWIQTEDILKKDRAQKATRTT